MRKQYYFRPSERGLLAWNVERLIVLSTHFPRVHVSLTAIRELDEPYWHGDDDIPFTWRTVLDRRRSLSLVVRRYCNDEQNLRQLVELYLR